MGLQPTVFALLARDWKGYGASRPSKERVALNRAQFNALRDLKDKRIQEDIKFAKSKSTSPLLIAEGIRIVNAHGVDARLTISYNPQVGSKTFNVHVPGVGPICRLDVDGPPHRPAGRSHKHALQTERCPDRNLPDQVVDRPELAGKNVRTLFAEFCRMTSIAYEGKLEAPDESGTGTS